LVSNNQTRHPQLADFVLTQWHIYFSGV